LAYIRQLHGFGFTVVEPIEGEGLAGATNWSERVQQLRMGFTDINLLCMKQV
jgi:hypothetical protein